MFEEAAEGGGESVEVVDGFLRGGAMAGTCREGAEGVFRVRFEKASSSSSSYKDYSEKEEVTY